MTPERSVLLLDARIPVASVLRDRLTASGCRVLGVDTYVPQAWRERGLGAAVTSPRRSLDGFNADVGRLCREHDVELVIPLLDAGLFLEGSALPSATQIAAPPPAIGWRLHDKLAFAELARIAGVPSPAPRRELDGNHGDALVVRPRFGRASQGFRRVDRRDIEPALLADESSVVTEWVPGADRSTLSVVSDGAIVTHVAYERCPELETGGAIAVRRLPDGYGSDEASALITAAGVPHGFVGFDLRENDDGIHVLECNPRPTPGVLLLDHATRAGPRSLQERWTVGSGWQAVLPGEHVRAWTRDWRAVDDIAADRLPD